MNKIITCVLLSFFSVSLAVHPANLEAIKKLVKNRYKQEKQKAEKEREKAAIATVASFAAGYVFKIIMNEGGLSKSEFMQQKIVGLPVAAYAWVVFGAVDCGAMIYAAMKSLSAYHHYQNAEAVLKEKEGLDEAHMRVKREHA